MKKTLLSLFALACTLTASADAVTFEKDGLKYEVTSPTTVRVAENKIAGVTVNVPASVEDNGTTYTVNSIGKEAFYWDNVINVTLPETIDSIYDSAFKSTKIVDLTLPSKLVYIGNYAFNSSNLESITIPASVKHIGGSAFFTCPNLQTVTFQGNVEELGKSIFYHTPVTKVTLSDDMTQIGDKMFLQCDKLTDINWPSKLEVIGEAAFNDCKLLPSVTLPASLKEIGDEAFLNCNKISSVAFPASLEKLGSCAFSKTSLKTITLDATNRNFRLAGDVLYSNDYRLLYLVPMKGKKTVKTMGACVGINGGAFWGSEVENVTLSKKVIAIDDFAFCQSALKSINLPNTLVFIGEQAFASTQLSGDLRLPENVYIVQDGAFAGNNGLTSVTIPSGVKYIFAHAFHNSKNLKTVTFEGSQAPEIMDVYEEYDSPFYNCPITKAYIPKGTTESYKKQYWNDYFTLTETDKGVLAYTATDPTDGSMFKSESFAGAVDITFAEEVTVVKNHPEVFLRQGNDKLDPVYSGKLLEPENEWCVTRQRDKKTVRVWAADYDSYLQSFTGGPKDKFVFVIPAGIVKNAAGEMNELILVRVNGYDPASGIANIDMSSKDATEAARFNISGVKIGKTQKGIAIIKMSDGSVKKVLVK